MTAKDSTRSSRSWMNSISTRAFALCFCVWMFTSAVMILRVPPFFAMLEEPELRLRDHFFTWRQLLARSGLPVRMPDTSGVALVAIDDSSVRRLGSYPPWPRAVYAELIDRLYGAGAEVVGLALVLEPQSPSDLPVPARTRSYLQRVLPSWRPNTNADEELLLSALSRFGKTVLGSTAELERREAVDERFPPELYTSAMKTPGAVGSVNLEPDADGILRRATLVSDRREMGQLRTSFALRVIERLFDTAAISTGDGGLWVRDRRIPSRININYPGEPSPFASVSVGDVLERLLKPDELKGKVVLVGFQDYSTPEGTTLPVYQTPVRRSRMTGLEAHAHIVNTLLTSRFLQEPSTAETVAVMFMCAMFLAYLLHVFFHQGRALLIGATFACGVWLVWSFFSFLYLDYYVPCAVVIIGIVVPCLLLMLAGHNFLESKERLRHTQLFHEMVSKRMAAQIDHTELSRLGLEGQRRGVSVLVCRVDGVAGLAEYLSPQDLLHLADELSRAMIEPVLDAGGLVWRAEGTSMTALWGAPLVADRQAGINIAVECGSRIRERAVSVLTGHQEALGNCRVAVGVASGDAVCGVINADRNAYTVIGSVVDDARRYARIGERYGVNFIVDRNVAEALPDGEVRELDESEVDGEPSREFYEYLGPRGSLPAVKEESSDLYAQAMAHYRSREYAQAASLLQSALRVCPEDRASIMLLAKCKKELKECPAMVREA